MSNCYDEKAKELVHKSHTGTGRTRTANEGNSVVTYEVYQCQCGGHTLDIFKGAVEKPAR
jgi:hypothetical protein